MLNTFKYHAQTKNTKNKCEDAKPETTQEVEAEKPKIRASKLEHKQVDEVYIASSRATTLLTFYYIVWILVTPTTNHGFSSAVRRGAEPRRVRVHCLCPFGEGF